MTSLARIEAAPRFATPRNPNRATLGPKVGKVMKAIDGDPMPWQSDALDVACEIDPATGRFWYRNVVWIVNRQAGKTSTSRAKVTHRCLTTPSGTVLYTAQDRNHARRRLEKSFYEPLDNSPLSMFLAKPRWAHGSEAVRFTTKAEIIIAAATKKTGGHGESGLDEAHLDEYFAHTDSRLEQAVSPMMITVDGAQKWITSAAGDTDSVPLWSKVEANRARLEAHAHNPAALWRSRTCYLEYSAPEDADRADPATWKATHPAIGYTIQLENIQAEFEELDAEEFDRAYLGWWQKAKPPPQLLPADAWDKCSVVNDGDGIWDGAPVWAVDTSPDREWSSIGMAARSLERGRIFGEVLKHELGTSWVVDYLVRCRKLFGGNVVVLDGAGAARSLSRALLDEGFEVRSLSTREKVDACSDFFDAVLERTFAHLDDPTLNDALAGAAKKNVGAGEGGFMWVRGRSLKDISPLYAVTLARHVMRELIGDDYDIADSIA